MRHGRLPDGFGVRIDPHVKSLSDGRVLVGASPSRMIALAPAEAAMIVDGLLAVRCSDSAGVARRLLDSGVGNPRPMSTPSSAEVTVVVPVRDNTSGLRRLLHSLRGLCVVVVDDGSAVPVDVDGWGLQTGSVTVLRHSVARGPAAARNTGLASVATEFVVFMDSDVVPRKGWLEVLLSHFSDPSVGLVAPRITTLEPSGTAIARYEHARSSLDLGRREAPVTAGGPVPCVPSAALAMRRRAIVEVSGFDETMAVPGAADLCWRLQEAGWRLRYEPVAQVGHDHRVEFRKWFQRSMFDGTIATPLAHRHAGKVSPVSMSKWTLLACLLAASATKSGLLGLLASLAVTVTRLRRVFVDLEHPTPLAGLLAAQGFVGGSWQLVSALLRQYWPLTVIAMLLSCRIRRLAIAIAVADGVWDWFEHREPGGLGPMRYTAYRRLDDLAYGAGLWAGAVESRDARALTPNIE